jgi:hypothetical protein
MGEYISFAFFCYSFYMDEFLKMNIFFFVATLATILIAVFAAVVLWRIQRILKNVDYISKQIAIESDMVRQDLAEMRQDVRAGKGRLRSLFGFVRKMTHRTSKDV